MGLAGHLVTATLVVILSTVVFLCCMRIGRRIGEGPTPSRKVEQLESVI